MDYEKKYNEMKHRVYEIGAGIAEGVDYSKPRQIADYICPELRESEDERVRKILIHIVKGACGKYGIKYKGDEITEEKLIAYLEKQKERNDEDEECTDFTIYHPLKNGEGKYECIPYSFYGSLTSFSEDKDLIDFLRTCFYTKEECNEWIEQQKEQKPEEKPVNWTELTWEDINELEDIINKVHYEFRNGIGQESFGKEVLEQFREYKRDEYLDEEQKPTDLLDTMLSKDPHLPKQAVKYQQKPVDNGIREKIISRATSEKQVVLISESSGNAEIGWDTRSLEDAKNLLEYGISFINKQLGVKPVKWSEEDENIIDNIICILQKDVTYTYPTRPYSCTGSCNAFYTHQTEIDWLKSLRPSWKPSEEQMYSLGTVVKGAGDNSVGSIAYNLKELYEQLKKLI